MIALNFHKVDSDGNPDFYTVGPAGFAGHLKEIRAQGLRVVVTEEVLAASVDDGMIMLLFDDGTEGHARHVFPMLEAEGVKGVFFVSTAKIGCPGYMTIAQVKELALAGHAIECHGHSHRRMDRMAPEQLDFELGTSAALIREWTGRMPRILAPPGGFITRRVIDSGRSHGFGVIRTMRWNSNPIPLPGMLDCLVVTRATTAVQVRRWLRGRGLVILRAAYVIKQGVRSMMPSELYLNLRSRLRRGVSST